MGHRTKLKRSSESVRCQSLPNSLHEQHDLVNNHCDNNKLQLVQEHDNNSLMHDLWGFNTWPERNDKFSKNVDDDDDDDNNTDPSNVCDNIEQQTTTNKSVNNILTLNEALESISLAYSPVTKQLHYLTPKPEPSHHVEVKLGHKRNEPGSFSSTISSFSDPSSSGSLLDADERIPSPGCCAQNERTKRRGFASFFTRNVFSWRSAPSTPVNSAGWKLFGKINKETPASSPKHEGLVASSSALIQHIRPAYLPAKDVEEDQRHRDEYRAMLAAAKKREAKSSAAKQKQHELQLDLEDQQANAARYWNTHILPKWDTMQMNKRTYDLWWQGLPSSVRGKVWCLAIGNDLNLTSQLYEICLCRAHSRLNNSDIHLGSESENNSLDAIQLDIARTFPHLCIFQAGGPYSDVLHSLLAAYACYRPDIGYVQGMSFIAAVLILNMSQLDAFTCFANLLNRPLHLAVYTLDQKQIFAYYSVYNELFGWNLPKLYAHFERAGLTPDLYLLEWIYTVYAKAMPLDIACRVWDVFLRDGDEFIFRTALGVLYLYQEQLLQMDFLHGAQFLTRLPDDLSAQNLFRSIQTVQISIGKQQTFTQLLLDKCKES